MYKQRSLGSLRSLGIRILVGCSIVKERLLRAGREQGTLLSDRAGICDRQNRGGPFDCAQGRQALRLRSGQALLWRAGGETMPTESLL